MKDHTIQSDNNNSEAHEAVTRVLSLMRETIVDEQATKIPDQPCGSMSPLFRSGEMKNRSTNKAQVKTEMKVFYYYHHTLQLLIMTNTTQSISLFCL